MDDHTAGKITFGEGGGGGHGGTVAVIPEVGESVVLTYTACIYRLRAASKRTDETGGEGGEARGLNLRAAVKLLRRAAGTYPTSAAVALNAGSMAGW